MCGVLLCLYPSQRTTDNYLAPMCRQPVGSTKMPGAKHWKLMETVHISCTSGGCQVLLLQLPLLLLSEAKQLKAKAIRRGGRAGGCSSQGLTWENKETAQSLRCKTGSSKKHNTNRKSNSISNSLHQTLFANHSISNKAMSDANSAGTSRNTLGFIVCIVWRPEHEFCWNGRGSEISTWRASCLLDNFLT